MSTTHLTLPADYFLWGVLESPSSRPSPSQLGYLFEDVLPVSIDDVQANYVRLADGRWLACGMLRDRLRALTAGDSAACTLVPSGLPEALESIDADCSRLNLLHGDCEPAAVRRVRHRQLMVLAAGLLAAVTLVLFGVQRRVEHLDVARQAVMSATEQVYRDVLGPQAVGPGRQPGDLQLTMELRQLQRTRRADIADLHAIDVVPSLASVLEHWSPDDARAEQVKVDAESIELRVTVEDAVALQRLASRLETLDGWIGQQPGLNGQQSTIRLDAEDRP